MKLQVIFLSPSQRKCTTYQFYLTSIRRQKITNLSLKRYTGIADIPYVTKRFKTNRLGNLLWKV